MNTRADLVKRINAALHGEEPEAALHGAVHDLLAEGHGRKELVTALEDFRAEELGFGTRRPDDDELVLDIMAVLDGWASETAVRNLLPPPCVAPHASSLS
jgi:hypothetical protein